MTTNNELIGNILTGLNVFYIKASQMLIYPMFTALFAIACAATLVFIILAIKNYLKYNLLLAIKLTTISIISFLITMDIYLVAFGKTALFILYIKFQKDLFFIIVACLVGLLCGRIISKGKDKNKVMP